MGNLLDNLYNLLSSNISGGGYDYVCNAHCNNSILLQMLEDFREENFTKVEEKLKSFSADYREYGFLALGEVEEEDLFEKWLEFSPNSDLPVLALASRKMVKGQKIRGVATVDAVSEEDMKLFQDLCEEARVLLLESQNFTSEFDINKLILLLTIYKVQNLEDRSIIHQTFQKGLAIDAKHIGLHLTYFTAISEKWGGTKEELSAYFQQIPAEPQLLSWCIQSTYYWDLIRVYMIDDEEKENEIRNFILSFENIEIPKENLYTYKLYLNLYWLSSALLEELEDKYYELVKPYWDDRIPTNEYSNIDTDKSDEEYGAELLGQLAGMQMMGNMGKEISLSHAEMVAKIEREKNELIEKMLKENEENLNS